MFTFRTPQREEHAGVDDHSDEEETHKARWSVPMSVGVLAASTVAIVFLSEFPSSVEPVVESSYQQAVPGRDHYSIVGNG